MATSKEQKQINDLFQKQIDQTNNFNTLIERTKSIESKRLIISQQISQNNKIINDLASKLDQLSDDQLKTLNDIVNKQNDLAKLEVKYNTLINNSNNSLKIRRDIYTATLDTIKNTWKYLQDQDKIIKSTILNLGMSGAKANAMRSSFENSAVFAARLGANLDDLQKIQEGYADETGRARVLTSSMLNDITKIGMGTGLGIEQAAKLGGQFEIMGVDAKTTMNYVQGVVETSERMGVNTTKVLKNINDNFKKLNTYNFQQGVKGFAQMAEFAEKFKVDISDALNAADTARTLEGAINMVAKLQVMGGEFAKMDMFETLYFARNDPKKLQEKIQSLTKNLVTLRKNSDGTFEKFISPADRDRLNQAGKALGIDAAKMTEMAERAFDIDKMSRQLSGTGLSKKQKELVEGAAIMNSKTGRFEVQLAGHMRDISTLTKDQANSFQVEQTTLEQRAKDSQNFNDTLKITIQELKAALLPILNGFNTNVLPKFKVFADIVSNGWGGIGAAAATLFAGAIAWKVVTGGLQNVANRLLESGPKLFSKGGSLLGKNAESKGSNSLGRMFNPKGSIKKGAGELTRAEGLKNLGTGGGIATAAVGIGAGIAIAATGISKLADSMSKLTPEMAKYLTIIVGELAAIPIVLIALAPAILTAGAAGTAGAVGLLAIGGAALMIGGAIGIAATGIGFMGDGLSKLVAESKNAGPSMIQVGKGIAYIAASMLGFTAGGIGFLVFAATMSTIASNATAMEKVGNAFANIKAVMSGSKEDFVAVKEAVESIGKMNTKGGGMLADLANLLKSPLTVKFANDAKVNLNNDITLLIDNDVFMHKIYKSDIAIDKTQSSYQGKSK